MDGMYDVNKLLEMPCYIIDVLPYQVAKGCGGSFFDVENYLLKNYDSYGFKERFIRIILKLMCYYSVNVSYEEWIDNPTPETVVEIMDKVIHNTQAVMDIVLADKNTLIQFEGDCLNISVYNPDNDLCELLKQLAWSEGLFFRQSN